MIKEDDTSVLIMNTDRKTVDSICVNQEIPLYDLEAVAGLRELFNSAESRRVLDTIKIPNLPKCDGAISVTGDSMYPLLKSGDIILYKETEFENIFFGEMYLLSVKLNDWEEYITVKYVQKSEQGLEYVKLVSQNSHHQSKDIHISKISALALIKASIRVNTMM
jgi:phage repressor protein C with HTH and peptisase S24 domain